ncbi:hypothetical protein L6452_00237 [Arctium lappa]|uniref:Uncharacterized protein n=1 Tax=Arctium lappa TaxID=4217 RepID=A0ACB9FER9_ARCLA|nr:hypothetical protein L6452_00237 [Arctium lappa]
MCNSTQQSNIPKTLSPDSVSSIFKTTIPHLKALSSVLQSDDSSSLSRFITLLHRYHSSGSSLLFELLLVVVFVSFLSAFIRDSKV